MIKKNEDVIHRLGLYHDRSATQDEESLEEAVARWHDQINEGNVDALRNLGMMYHLGDFLRKDEAKGFALLERAMQAGDPKAEYIVSDCLILGQGAEKDETKGLRHLLNAANRGSDAAQVTLADRFSLGAGMKKDAEQSMDWLMRSARQGNTEAYCRAADHWFRNHKKRERVIAIARAYMWASLGAKKGHPLACLIKKAILSHNPPTESLLMGIEMENSFKPKPETEVMIAIEAGVGRIFKTLDGVPVEDLRWGAGF